MATFENSYNDIDYVRKSKSLSFSDALKWIVSRSHQTGNTNGLVFYGVLNQWNAARRPYFNVYPSVIRCLLNTKMDMRPCDVPESVIHELRFISVRLPQPEFPFAKSFWLAIGADGDGKKTVGISAQRESGGVYMRGINWDLKFSENSDKTSDQGGAKKLDSDQITSYYDLSRIALGVMLLAADPKFISPVVMKKDRDSADKDAAARRARKRGLIGYDIGREMKTHHQSPYFAIRWTGPGKMIPRLTPVSGSGDRSDALTSVPTGYEGTQ